jgi:hypothetical protein
LVSPKVQWLHGHTISYDYAHELAHGKLTWQLLKTWTLAFARDAFVESLFV